MDFLKRVPPLVIAHRGGAGLYPENTTEAFRRALTDHRADAVELDIHPTRDYQWVVIHDNTVDRTTNATGRVDEMTVDQIKELDAGWHYTNEDRKSTRLNS